MEHVDHTNSGSHVESPTNPDSSFLRKGDRLIIRTIVFAAAAEFSMCVLAGPTPLSILARFNVSVSAGCESDFPKNCFSG